MHPSLLPEKLSEVLSIVHALGGATVGEVRRRLWNLPPSEVRRRLLELVSLGYLVADAQERFRAAS